MAYCTKCGGALVEGAAFCNNCGAKAVQAGQTVSAASTGLSFPMKFTVTRESQFVCAGNSYKVIINGIDLGKIGVGKTLTTTINSEIVHVEIRCTTIMMTGIHATFKLKVKQSNPGVVFKLQLGGPIDARVVGADIVDFNGAYGK